MLVNPHASSVVVVFAAELARRQRSKARWARDWWRTRRHFHQAWRGVRTFARVVYRVIASAPKKAFLDLLTALLIALLVVPRFRDWFFHFEYSWLFYALIILSRVAYGVWHRSNMLDTARDEAGRALRKMLPVIECTQI